ncbi:hypothetical protein BD414DRAFT_499075 [Trametes punicea]|nr:hypothetical protein BD414DRAFT_499075 [Trametes punicea]
MAWDCTGIFVHVAEAQTLSRTVVGTHTWTHPQERHKAFGVPVITSQFLLFDGNQF